jgi:hypothetical protein
MATTKNDKANASKAAEKLGHAMTQFDTEVVGISTISCTYCVAEVSVDQDRSTPYREPWGSALEEQCRRTGV